MEHHAAGLDRLAKDSRGSDFASTVKRNGTDSPLSKRELALVGYAIKLNDQPANMRESDLDEMRSLGIRDAEILHANLVVGYFAFANRLTLGLGVKLEPTDHGIGE